MKFTKEQLTTLISDRNQIVIANAGSGKTTILVEKYIELIKQFPPSELEKIVAITFTKKAAAEMKERIISQLNKEIDNLKANHTSKDAFFREYQILMEYRENISGAKIQTIHSFCQDILKEYAVEAGFSPNFYLLEETLLEELKDNFFKETLEEFLLVNEKSNNKALEFFDSIDRNVLHSIIMYLFSNHKAKEYLKKYVKNQTFEEYRSELLPTVLKQFENLNKYLINEILKEKQTLLDDNAKNNNLGIYFTKIEEGFPKISIDNYIEVLQQINQFWEEFFKIKVKGNKQPKGYLFDTKSIDKALDKLKNASSLNYLKSYFELNKFILMFFENFEFKIEDYKIENSVITYDDMLYKTHKILKNKEIADKLRSKYRYLLIDEFQDTDDIQYSIVNTIIPCIENPLGKESEGTAKLFIVGDPKQSIYGFRSADVRVMKKAESDIKTSNEQLFIHKKISDNVELNHRNLGRQILNLTSDETFGKIELKVSHRLNLINTAFINLLFENLMSNDSFDFAVKYNPFIFARENPYLDELEENKAIISESENDMKYGSVKFLINIENKNIDQLSDENGQNDFGASDESEQQEDNSSNGYTEIVLDNEKEGQLVAKYINYLVLNDNYIFDSKQRTKRRIKYSDIGILVRKRNGVDKLLKQMDNLRIPYFLNDAKNFFQTQEVIDIISFLKFLGNPDDDLAFASLLKSNFFGFNDNELLTIREFSSNSSLFVSFQNFMEISKEYKHERAYSMIKYFKESFLRIPLDQLLQEILEKTNYFETFALNPSRQSIITNIKSFINFTKKISNRGLSTYSDLLNEINKSYTDNIVSEDSIVLDENSVNLLTIHKSKGLEFPVVILYNMNSKGGNLGPINFDENNGLTFKFKALDENSNMREIKMPMYEFSRDYAQKREEEEAKRILYVASTRAKDLLILSSTLKVKAPKKDNPISFINPIGLVKLVFDGMSINNKDIYDIIDENKIYLNNVVTSYINNEYKKIQFSFNIPIITEIDQNIGEFENNFSNYSYFLMMDEVSSNPPVFSNSATKIQAFLKKPVDFIERYVLQLPEILKTNHYITKEGELSGADRGTLIHKGMSELNSWVNEENTFNKTLLQGIINNEAYTNSIEITEIQLEEIVDEVLSVVNSNFIKNHLSELLLSEKELELNMPFGNDFIQVIIDSLVRMKDGSYEIWDWKSNVVKDEEKFNELTENYKIQLKYYAFVVSYLYPEQEKFIARLFFTRLAESSKEDKDWIATFEWSRNELNEFSNELVEYFDKMHNPEEMYKYLIENL